MRPPRAFIQKPEDLVRTPRMQDWKQIGAEAVLGGRVRDNGGTMRVEFRLWDVSTGQQLVGRALETGAANWRRLAHKISDSVFERVTGAGLFRKGAWPGSQPKRWDVYEQLTRQVHVASDHHMIWAEIA